MGVRSIDWSWNASTHFFFFFPCACSLRDANNLVDQQNEIFQVSSSPVYSNSSSISFQFVNISFLCAAMPSVGYSAESVMF
jgi:hypothetical protein